MAFSRAFFVQSFGVLAWLSTSPVFADRTDWRGLDPKTSSLTAQRLSPFMVEFGEEVWDSIASNCRSHEVRQALGLRDSRAASPSYRITAAIGQDFHGEILRENTERDFLSKLYRPFVKLDSIPYAREESPACVEALRKGRDLVERAKEAMMGRKPTGFRTAASFPSGNPFDVKTELLRRDFERSRVQMDSEVCYADRANIRRALGRGDDRGLTNSPLGDDRQARLEDVRRVQNVLANKEVFRRSDKREDAACREAVQKFRRATDALANHLSRAGDPIYQTVLKGEAALRNRDDCTAYVVDASGSMASPFQGDNSGLSKIASARLKLSALAAQRSRAVFTARNAGTAGAAWAQRQKSLLIGFGEPHSRAELPDDKCSQYEVATPFLDAAIAPSIIQQAAQRIDAPPEGDTPLLLGLLMAEESLKPCGGKRQIVILTDGGQRSATNCRRHFCSAFKEMIALGIDVDIQVRHLGDLDSTNFMRDEIKCLQEVENKSVANTSLRILKSNDELLSDTDTDIQLHVPSTFAQVSNQETGGRILEIPGLHAKAKTLTPPPLAEPEGVGHTLGRVLLPKDLASKTTGALVVADRPDLLDETQRKELNEDTERRKRVAAELNKPAPVPLVAQAGALSALAAEGASHGDLPALPTEVPKEAYVGDAPVTANDARLLALENRLFFHPGNGSVSERIAKLEEYVTGEARRGPDKARLENLLKMLNGPDGKPLMGGEVIPLPLRQSASEPVVASQPAPVVEPSPAPAAETRKLAEHEALAPKSESVVADAHASQPAAAPTSVTETPVEADAAPTRSLATIHRELPATPVAHAKTPDPDAAGIPESNQTRDDMLDVIQKPGVYHGDGCTAIFKPQSKWYGRSGVRMVQAIVFQNSDLDPACLKRDPVGLGCAFRSGNFAEVSFGQPGSPRFGSGKNATIPARPTSGQLAGLYRAGKALPSVVRQDPKLTSVNGKTGDFRVTVDGLKYGFAGEGDERQLDRYLDQNYDLVKRVTGREKVVLSETRSELSGEAVGGFLRRITISTYPSRPLGADLNADRYRNWKLKGSAADKTPVKTVSCGGPLRFDEKATAKMLKTLGAPNSAKPETSSPAALHAQQH